MKTKILLAILCLCTIDGFSQDSTFLLRDFKFRTPLFRTLQLRVNLNGTLSDQKNDGLSSSARGLFLAPAQINYTKYISTDRFLKTSNFSLSPGFSSQVQEEFAIKRKQRQYDGSIAYSFNNKYYKANNSYFELGNELKAAVSGFRRTGTNINDRFNISSATNRLTLGYGRGRIEYVQDAQMALHILKDLREAGLVSSEPGSQTIHEFAQVLTRANYTRVLDFRRKRIFELTQIENFLRTRGIIQDPDIRHFAIINDNWLYAFNPFRQSGSTWYVRMIGMADLDRSRFTSRNANLIKEDYDQISSGLGPELGFENYRPLNLTWQRNMGIVARVQKNFYKSETRNSLNNVETKTKSGDHQLDGTLRMFYGVGYFPNTRTSVNGELSIEANHTIISHNTLLSDISGIRPELDIYVNYFLGYRTQLNATFSLAYEKKYYDYIAGGTSTARNLNGGFSVNLVHNIF